MAIDIFAIQPSVISRDLSGKSFFIYGDKKSGKTSNAVRFPKPLLVAFEKGYNMLSGVMAQPVNKWKEAIDIKKQLLKDAKAVEDGDKKETTFKTIVVDTADIGYDMCEAFILAKEGVEYLDETESKRGYKAVEREFDGFFQEIVKAGYTLVVISHSETKQLKENGEKYDRTQPTVDKRGLKVLARLVDVIGYSTFEPKDDGTNEMVLYLRGSKNLEAGSRNKYMSAKIPFTYNALLTDMQQAIDKLAKDDGAVVSDKPIEVYKDQTENADFETTMSEIRKIAMAFKNQDISDKYTTVTNNRLGKGKLVRDCDITQIDLLMLVIEDLRDIIKEDGILID
jgi:hypothetical protein